MVTDFVRVGKNFGEKRKIMGNWGKGKDCGGVVETERSEMRERRGMPRREISTHTQRERSRSVMPRLSHIGGRDIVSLIYKESCEILITTWV